MAFQSDELGEEPAGLGAVGGWSSGTYSQDSLSRINSNYSQESLNASSKSDRVFESPAHGSRTLSSLDGAQSTKNSFFHFPVKNNSQSQEGSVLLNQGNISDLQSSSEHNHNNVEDHCSLQVAEVQPSIDIVAEPVCCPLDVVPTSHPSNDERQPPDILDMKQHSAEEHLISVEPVEEDNVEIDAPFPLQPEPLLLPDIMSNNNSSSNI